MQTIMKKLRFMKDEELLALCEAVDLEIDRRQERIVEIPESARRRAILREQSYRRATGSSAPPVRVTGLKEPHKRRPAA